MPASRPSFPSTIAPYSWFTGMLSTGRFDAASLLYVNGFGVELGDTPQSVLLGADGSTYRRVDQAESLSVASDQGDPATTVLSPDGTFVVIGSSGGTGRVEVVTLGDGRQRSIPIGSGRTRLPIAVAADGQTVLLAVSRGPVDRYMEGNSHSLARLDLGTHEVRDNPIEHLSGAALSPDGSRIAVLGWRDSKSVLVHDTGGSEQDNAAAMSWVDSATGQADRFASYTPNFTGASMGGVDAARDLVGRWRVEARPVERGPLALVPGLVVACLIGLLAAGMTATIAQYRSPADLP